MAKRALIEGRRHTVWILGAIAADYGRALASATEELFGNLAMASAKRDLYEVENAELETDFHDFAEAVMADIGVLEVTDGGVSDADGSGPRG